MIIEKNNNFKNLGKNQKGISRGSMLGSVIVNFMLSNAFPKDVMMLEDPCENQRCL